MDTISKALSNKNVVLGGLLIFVLGVGITILSFNSFSNSIQEQEREWETTLKFTTENEVEFPYSIKTQQGNLYATGPLYEDSPLVSNEHIDGEWLAIKEHKEEYRPHTETYSCNCRTVNGHTSCSTCTRTVWSWDWAGTSYQRVERIKLLGQEMDSKMFNWEGGWLDGNYVHKNTKEGKHYYYYSSSERSSFSAIPSGVVVSQGFRSDQNGFVVKDIQPDGAGGMKTIRLVVTLLLSFLTLGGTIAWIYFNYETYNDHYIK